MSAAMDDEAFTGTCPTCGQSYLQAEIARLKEQLRLYWPAIEELTKKCEMYRMRWLGSMTTRDAQLIRDENARLRSELETALYRFRFIREGGEAGERALRLAIPDIEHALSFNGEQAAGEKK